MGQVIEFPRQPARGTTLYTECAAVDGEIMLVIGEKEYWMSADDFGKVLEVWSETLGDALAQLGAELR